MTVREHQIGLKPREQYKLIGKSLPSLDIPPKTNGKAKYGIDVFLPNMAYGALVAPRTRYASKVVSIDDSDAKKIPGFIKAVKIDDAMGKCTGWLRHDRLSVAAALGLGLQPPAAEPRR